MTEALLRALGEAQHLGFIGPGDLGPHLAHAEGFMIGLGGAAPDRVVDLGSGGGLPSLVMAEAWVGSRFWLVEANQRRVAFLEEAVETLGWSGRVTVLNGRAEELGRDESLRGSIDVVTARGFGPPAVTAECAAPFLRVGGRLAVSEPPVDASRDQDRWPDVGLDLLGLASDVVAPGTTAHFAVFHQRATCPDRYPRRVGIPAKRPLF
jgi:16S rRNA (guanine527-N7)-methyltransferase